MSTNDTRHPVSELKVTGQVKKFANISPPRVVLNGDIGVDLKATVKISPVTEGLFEITEAKADTGKDIRFTLTHPKKNDGNIYTLLIENRRETPGRYHDTIRLRTTNKVQEEILIPVWGNIRPPQIASVRPRHVVLNGTATEAIKRTVTIIPREKHDFSITEVKAHSGKEIKWDLKETKESGKKTYTLTVENLKKEKGTYYDTLFLKTDNPELPEIRIIISGRITD